MGLHETSRLRRHGLDTAISSWLLLGSLEPKPEFYTAYVSFMRILVKTTLARERLRPRLGQDPGPVRAGLSLRLPFLQSSPNRISQHHTLN
jgi:hypothetical protein